MSWQDESFSFRRCDEPPTWMSAPARFFGAPAPEAAVTPSALPSPQASPDLALPAGLEIEITDLTADTNFDPQ